MADLVVRSRSAVPGASNVVGRSCRSAVPRGSIGDRFQDLFRTLGISKLRLCIAPLLLALLTFSTAAQPLISEFMAENKSVLADSDGQYSDWIEIYNRGPGSLDLGGYSLTDERSFPAKWRIPAGVVLPAGEFRIIFASGKNRTAAAGELHTNFQLSRDGEYLALVAPDGLTVIQSFDPYPAQREDVSFGPGRAVEPVALVTSNSLLRARVPADSSLAQSWTGGNEPFDDNTWTAGLFAVGYDKGVGGASPLTNKLASTAFTYRYEMDVAPSGQDLDLNLTNDWANIYSPPVSGGIAQGTNGLTFDANFAGSLWRAQFGTNFTAEFGVRVFQLGTEGTLGTLSFTASKGNNVAPWLNIRRSGASWGTVSPTSLGAHLNTDAAHLFRIARQGNQCWVWRDHELLNPGGQPLAPATTIAAGANALFLGDNSANGNNGAWQLNYIRLHPEAMAPDVEPNLFGGLIRTDLAGAMHAVNASAYVRVPFTMPGSVSQFSNLVLRVQWDDGFVCYLNGVEVARRNAPASLGWNSAALTNRSDALALAAEQIDLTPFRNVLVAGTNLLAYHMLSSGAEAQRALLVAELDGVRLQQTNVFFHAATPGAANVDGSLPPLPQVEFSVGSRLFTSSVTVALSNSIAEAAIFFTTNGAVPVPGAAMRYTGPLILTNSVQVRARAFLAGWSPSSVKSESFVQSGTDLAGFSSPLPVMVLHNFAAGAVPGVSSRGPNGDGSDVVAVAMQPQAMFVLERDSSGLTRFTNNPTASSRVGLRVRGSSAFSNTKKSYALETWGEEDLNDHELPLLGLPEESDWVLYGPSWKFASGSIDFDAALIHNSFIYELANQSGYQAPRTRFVEVFLNTNGGPVTAGNHIGLFVLTEKIKRDNNRVVFEPLSPDGTSGGWMISSDRMDALPPGSALGSMVPRHFHTAGPDRILQTPDDNPRGFQGIGAGGLPPARDDMPNYYHSFFNFESPGGWELTAGQRAVITNFMHALNEALYGPAYTNPLTGYPAFIDVDNWVHHLILQNFPKNQDAEVLSTYFVREHPGARLRHGPIWDFDRAYNRNPTSSSPTANLDWCKDRLYYPRLFSDTNFQQAYIDKWQALRRSAFATSNLLAIVDRQANEIAPGGTNNSVLLREGMTDFPARIAAFKGWITNRVAALDAQFLKMPLFNQDGGAISNGFALAIKNANGAGTIFFTLDGSDPRALGGGVSAAAQSWPQEVVINEPTVVRARVQSAGRWSGLAEALFVPPQDLNPLILTELMYNPPALGGVDGDEFEFLELKNSGTVGLNLSGMRFTGITFTFTNGTVLGPGEFFVLARNAAAFRNKYPGIAVGGIISGRLDNSGEPITLFSPAGTPVFSVDYDDAAPWPLAADGFGFSLVPRMSGAAQASNDGSKWRASAGQGGSPGADDPLPPIPGVVLNELLTHTDLPHRDSIELYNPTPLAADITGWFLSDDAANPRKYRFPAGSTIPAFGFITVTEDDFNPTPGTNLSFSLSSVGEVIYLCSGNGTNLTGYSHGVTFGAAAHGISFGRYINSAGEEHWPAQLLRTLNGTNAGPRVGPAVLSEIFYHPVNGGIEFVEIANISSAPLPLFDSAIPTNTWRVSGIGYTFPPNFTLPPGGVVVIAGTNEAAFRSLYPVPSQVPVLGPFTGALQDSGELLAVERPDAPQPDGVVPYIVVDAVRYNDKAPWPSSADGAGDALHRASLDAYGNEPLHWFAAAPSPGMISALDTDGDGMPDQWEVAHGFDVHDPTDAQQDNDTDGLSSLEEFAAGTDPRSAGSTLKLELSLAQSGATLRFLAMPGRSYALQARDSLGTAGGWVTVLEQPAGATAAQVEWVDPNGPAQQFYRLVLVSR